MQTLKLIYNYIEAVFATFWGLTVIDFLAIPKTMEFNLQTLISSSVQSIYIVVGLIYFILNGIYRHQSKQLERETKRIQNKRAQLDLDNLEDRRKKN